ncbi:zinc ribbon domain-containing protein [Streptomyces roseus]|uniref:zinc ribbon domain-containing protein n=1 Tax=Streptomyces roseus TaxID=66430 RepID=UPI0033CDE409
MAALASGQDSGGRQLPSNAWMALRRLGWSAEPSEGTCVNDRIVRMAQEQAGRTLRSAQWRAELVAGVLGTWPADPSRRTADEWAQVRAAVPGGQHLPSGVINGHTRRIAAFLKSHGCLPEDVFDLEGAPRAARMLLLSACDGQQAAIERADVPDRAQLRLQLPTRPDPRSYGDWTWVACPIVLPPTVPAGAMLHLPTLRPDRGRVRVDLAYTHAVPKAARTGHTVALGVDWGLNTLLSCGAARLHDGGVITPSGAGAMFRAAGVLAKQHRLRRQAERLQAKSDHYQQLIGGDRQHVLTARHGIVDDEIHRVAARRSNLNDALAWAAARWAVDQAITAGASVIYLEDLRSMEARGMGRTHNTRMAQTVRSKIVDRIRHIAAETGIAVVTVPPRNTSRHCPRCLAPLRHRKAPDAPKVPGWKWALCPGCGWQGDRDQGAWQRIVARGLAHQAKTATDRTAGTLAIRTIVDGLEAGAVITPAAAHRIPRPDRSKNGPTRPRPTRPAPRRRRTPSPAGPSAPAGKRPEGHAHTGRFRLPRAAGRHQGATAIEPPAPGPGPGDRETGRHRPRGALLGAGFHLHAHATPPRWEQVLEPDTLVRLGITRSI